MKIYLAIAGIGFIAILTFLFFTRPVAVPVLQPTTHLNATYLIAGQPVTLKEGLAEVPAAPGSASVVTTRYFGNEVEHDFNGDGAPDKAFLITQETGGSGAFFYLVVALRDGQGYRGSEAVYIGDRIAPQTTNVDEKGIILVNYADRAPGEAFTVRPSQGKTLRLKFDPATLTLGELVVDFEGESNVQ